MSAVSPLVCFHCGTSIAIPQAKVYFRGELGIGTPVFCLEKCAHAYIPEVLTLAKLTGLQAQIKL